VFFVNWLLALVFTIYGDKELVSSLVINLTLKEKILQNICWEVSSWVVGKGWGKFKEYALLCKKKGSSW
jgi:hypothetical protein